MQESFGFFADEIGRWRQPLTHRFGTLADVPRRRPLGQLVKSMISSRTRDAVSLRAYQRLGQRWRRAAELAKAAPPVIERTIFDVTFAEKKAVYLPAALGMIEQDRPDFTLDFLAGLEVEEALAWLERLPGVGRKVATAALNASTLRRPVFIVDSHVHRVLSDSASSAKGRAPKRRARRSPARRA
jgi:endonuclease-3